MIDDTFPKQILEHKNTKEKFYIKGYRLQEGVPKYKLVGENPQLGRRLVKVSDITKYYYIIGYYE